MTYPLPDRACWWVAIDGESGQHVAAAVASPRELPRFEAVKGERHIHLAAITDLVLRPDPSAVPGGVIGSGAGVAIAELVPGQTLHGQLKRGRIHPFKAVAWLLRLVDAVQRLHGKGAPHGAISPFTIVVEPVGRAIAPVLGSLVAPPIAAYCSPERLAGAGPSPEDDVWALHVVLYAALTGSLPFDGDAQTLLKRVKAIKPKPLADYGVSDPILQRILDRGLALEAMERVADLEGLTSSLDAWERGRELPPQRPKPPRLRRPSQAAVVETLAFDLAPLLGVESLPTPESVPTEAPAALPAPVPAPVPAQPPVPFVAAPPPPGRRPRRLVAVAGGVLLTAVGAALVFAWLSRAPARTEWEPEAAVPTPPSASTAAAAASAPGPSPRVQVAQCVHSYFEDSAITAVDELEFLCGDDPFPVVASRLFRPADPEPTAAPAPSAQSAGILVTGVTAPYDLGWYEIPAAAIVRSTCCPRAKPVTLPTSPGWCDQLQGHIRVLADASRKPVDLSPYVRKYEDAVQCLFSTGTRHGYAYPQPPSDLQRQRFQRFLKQAAESDAKRSRMRWLK